jgi:hypothetical protein
MGIELASGEGKEGMVLSFSGEDDATEERSEEKSEDQKSSASDDEQDAALRIMLGDSEDEEDGDLEVESEEEDEKGEEPRIPKSRLDKQRKKFEKRIQTLSEQLESAKKPSDAEKEFLKLYDAFKNPVKAVQSDKRFMDHLEKLKDNPAVQGAIKVILADMEGKKLPETNLTAREPKEDPKPDPRVDKLLSQERNRRIDQFLGDASVNQKGPYWKGLRKEMVSRVSGSDIDELSDESLVKIAEESLQELGWTAKQVQEQKRPSGRKEPPTGQVRSAARSRTPEPKGEGGKKAEGPKTVREWEEEGRGLLEQLAQRAS